MSETAPQTDTSGDELPDESQDETRMSFGDHLEELRKYFIRGLIGVGVILMLTLYYGRDIAGWLAQPLMRALHKADMSPEVIAQTPTSPFTMYLKISIFSAIIIGVPWIVYQIWKFIEPGLYKNEKKIVYALAPFSAAMTAIAVVFMYYMLLPVCLSFMVNFAKGYPLPQGDKPGMFEWLTDSVKWFAGSDANEQLDDGSGGTKASESDKKLGEVQGDGKGRTEPDAPGDGAQTPADSIAEPVVLTIPRFENDPESPVEGQIWFNKTKRAIRLHANGETQTYRAAATSILRTMITLSDYVSFVIFLTIGVVIGFQLPVLMMVIGWSKALDPKRLAGARRYAILVIMVISAILTPSDPISMLVLAIPMMILFEIGLILMRRTYGDGPQPWFDEEEGKEDGDEAGNDADGGDSGGGDIEGESAAPSIAKDQATTASEPGSDSEPTKPDSAEVNEDVVDEQSGTAPSDEAGADEVGDDRVEPDGGSPSLDADADDDTHNQSNHDDPGDQANDSEETPDSDGEASDRRPRE